MANKPLQSIKFPGLSDTYTTPQVDATLTTTGAAADAKKVGGEITSIKQDLSELGNTSKLRDALLLLASKVAYIDDQGAAYYRELENALYNRKSDMEGWSDGIAYTNVEIVENSYVASATGVINNYNGWNRTGYVPCNGASKISFPPLSGAGSPNTKSSWFYDQNKQPVGDGPIWLSQTNTIEVDVPSGAYYFIISCTASALAACVNAGIVPYGQEV